MDKHKDQKKLVKVITQSMGLPQTTVELFIELFFSEIEESLVNEESINLEGLGIFRTIKSGNAKKVLFLASKKGNKQEAVKSKDSFIGKDTIKTEDKTIPRPASISTVKTNDVSERKSIPLSDININKTVEKSKPISKEEERKTVNLIENQAEQKNTVETDTKAILNNKIVVDSKIIDKSINDKIDDSNSTKITQPSDLLIQEKKDNNLSESNIEVKKPERVPEKKQQKTHPVVKKEQKKTSGFLPIIIAIFLILAIAGVGYLFFYQTSQNNSGLGASNNINDVKFEQLVVEDSLNYSYMIIPNKDVSILEVSKKYYGNEVFWPYIYISNENSMNNSIIATGNSIIKIPRLSFDLASYNNGSFINAAKTFGEEIAKSKDIKF